MHLVAVRSIAQVLESSSSHWHGHWHVWSSNCWHLGHWMHLLGGADLHGLGTVVHVAPIIKVHNFDIGHVKVLEVGVRRAHLSVLCCFLKLIIYLIAQKWL